jgi:hypothetical protein
VTGARSLAVSLALLLSGCGTSDRRDSQPLDLGQAPGCYEMASLDADVVAVAPSSDPRAACAALWLSGAVDGSDSRPELTVCVGKNGVPLVFPTSKPSTCRDLGLADPE